MTVDMKQVQEFINKREIYCKNHCAFKVEVIRSREKQVSENEIARRTDEAILICTGCGFIDPIEFENQSGDF